MCIYVCVCVCAASCRRTHRDRASPGSRLTPETELRG